MKLIRIATRNSPLALWQANYVKDELIKAHSNLTVKIVGMTTKGDELLDRSLAPLGGKGLFLKELEVSLLSNETDIAVHSMKDVPVEIPEGLEISCLCKREDPHDAMVSNKYRTLYALPEGAKVGTSSLRRIAQLQSEFPKVEFIALRGNVNSRLKKLDAGDYDAIILAAAGLIRLGFADRIKQYIKTDICLPAVGQGIVGIECRADDLQTKNLLAPLHDLESELCNVAERAMNMKLQGGCHAPIAGFASVIKGKLQMRGLVSEVNGPLRVVSKRTAVSLSLKEANNLGTSIAIDLIEQGAMKILDELRQSPVAVKAPEIPTVILTRQKEFLGNLSEMLTSMGYRTEHIPTIQVDAKMEAIAIDHFKNLSGFTDLIFVSRNAVEYGLKMIQSHQSYINSDMRVIAVGAETARQLYKYGIEAMFPNSGVGVDALLKVGQMENLSGRKILIIRGDEGLEWPIEEMRHRGAVVEHAICYRKSQPLGLGSSLNKLLSSSNQVRGIFIHSPYSAKNLINSIGSHQIKLSKTTLIAGSQRIADTAQSLGWTGKVKVAKSPSNKHMMISFSSAVDKS